EEAGTQDGNRAPREGAQEGHRRILKAGGRVGIGGDYGFAWTPHGTYARELTFFVRYVGFSPLETITCATKTGAEIMGRGDEFGSVTPGKLADLLVVDGDVLADISLLEDRANLIAVMQGGGVKAGGATGSWGGGACGGGRGSRPRRWPGRGACGGRGPGAPRSRRNWRGRSRDSSRTSLPRSSSGTCRAALRCRTRCRRRR